MELDKLINQIEDPRTRNVTLDLNELVEYLKELRDARKLIRMMSQYIECYIDRRGGR